jgi:hypothetical protein
VSTELISTSIRCSERPLQVFATSQCLRYPNVRSGSRLIDRSNMTGALATRRISASAWRLTYGLSTNLTMKRSINGQRGFRFINIRVWHLQADMQTSLTTGILPLDRRTSIRFLTIQPPRKALLFNITPTQTLRATFNHASTTNIRGSSSTYISS